MLSRLLPTRDQLQIRLMPTKVLVNKMHGSMNPNGREMILDGCEAMRRRVTRGLFKDAHRKSLMEHSALELLLDVLKLWMEDAPVANRAARALGKLTKDSGKVSDRVLELGGLRLAEQCKDCHPDDLELQKAAKDLIRALTQRSGKLAQKEIRICKFCAMNGLDMESAKQLGQLVNPFKQTENFSRSASMVRKKTDKGADAGALSIRVLAHMQAHIPDQRVQDAGLDALVELAQNHDDGGALLKNDGAKAVVAAIGAHEANYAVQWKACACVQAMARRPALSAELGKAGAVGALKRVYDNFNAEPSDDREVAEAGGGGFGDDREVRQQAVWALGALVAVKGNVERMRRARVYEVVQDVLARLDDRQVLPEEKVALPLGLRAVWSDEELQEFRLRSIDQRQTEAREAEEGANPQAGGKKKRTDAFPRKKKGKFAKIDDEFAKGIPGLVD